MSSAPFGLFGPPSAVAKTVSIIREASRREPTNTVIAFMLYQKYRSVKDLAMKNQKNKFFLLDRFLHFFVMKILVKEHFPRDFANC